jgi:hypothetical protein
MSTKKYTFKSTVGAAPENTEWWTPEQHEAHQKHVEECKKDGTYGNPLTIEVELVVPHNNFFDEPPKEEPPKKEWSGYFIDQSESK